MHLTRKTPEHQSIMLIWIWASLELGFRSYSRLCFWQRPSQANVRSATQRHWITWKLLLPAGRPTTSSCTSGARRTNGSSCDCGTWYPPRASSTAATPRDSTS